MGRIVLLIFGGVLAIASCVGLWFVFDPQTPPSAIQRASQPESGFEAGGFQCEARNVLAIPDPAARQAKRDECAQRREQHRAQQSDLVQQTRAANAAEVVASLTRDQTRITLLVAVLSLVSTLLIVWTLWETRASTRRELRAYVFPHITINHISHFTRREQGKLLNDLGVIIAAVNSGQTPATAVTTWTEMAILPSADESTLTVPKTLERKSVSVIASGNHIQSQRVLPGRMPPAVQAGLSDGSLAMFVWGRISYFDVFDRHRVTNFRFRYMGAWPPHKGAVMTFCDRGNDHT